MQGARSPLTGRVPTLSTALIKREAEKSRAQAPIRSRVRLLKLTGLGGMEKIRRAIQVGTSFRDDFTDGGIWVAVAETREADAVLIEITLAAMTSPRCSTILSDARSATDASSLFRSRRLRVSGSAWSSDMIIQGWHVLCGNTF